MRCLRLGRILQPSAPPTPQTVDPVENAGRPPTPEACEPLAEPAKHRGCVGVGHEHASELALLVPFDEPDAARAGNDAQRVKPTMVVLPCDGPDATTHDGLEQSLTLQIGEINAAPMLALARRVKRSGLAPVSWRGDGLGSGYMI